MGLEQVLRRLNIEAKKTGKEWTAKCPNPEHNDRNPSWRIHDEPGKQKHGLHKCWSCGFCGNLTALVMTAKELGFSDARAWLNGEGVQIIEEEPPPETVTLQVLARKKRFQIPDGVEFTPLEKWVTPARKYIEQRGIPAWQVERWGLGFAVDGVLGGRIIIPYRDARGIPRGYTARTFTNQPKRYKEPDAWEGSDSSIIFGEQHWMSVARATVHVAEGALNALAIERAISLPGETEGAYVAATAGSSLRAAHIAKLSLFSRVVVLTDPDLAGNKLAEQIASQLSRHTQVVRGEFRAGTDAADIQREELQRVILKAA